MSQPQASIIITNHNYARFLGQTIDSALAQTCADTEVIVVDDGSTDDSRDILRHYGSRIRTILKENGGQGSAFNAGFSQSAGDVVLFLDADDLLFPSAVESAVERLRAPGAAKVHWPLEMIDAAGDRLGKLLPSGVLAEGNLLEALVHEGPWMASNPPTSGNAWTREFLKQVFPMPTEDYRICADAYLLALAPIFGELARIDRPLGCYREHGQNAYSSQSFEAAVRNGSRLYAKQCNLASRFLRARGREPDLSVWLANSWWHKLGRTTDEICALVPPGESFILVDGDELGCPRITSGRRRIAFIEQDGEYWGAPDDDAHALDELHRHKSNGASLMVLAWPAFSWLEEYSAFATHVERNYPCVLSNDRVKAFDLRQA